jgi:hypothetical protein
MSVVSRPADEEWRCECAILDDRGIHQRILRGHLRGVGAICAAARRAAARSLPVPATAALRAAIRHHVVSSATQARHRMVMVPTLRVAD